MNIIDIHSIELDRTKPFNQVIKIKDKAGYVMETIPVKQTNANEVFATINKAWWEAIDKLK